MKFRMEWVILTLASVFMLAVTTDVKAFGGRHFARVTAVTVVDECDECAETTSGVSSMPQKRHQPRFEMEAPVYFANTFPEYTLGNPNILAGHDDDAVFLNSVSSRTPFRYRYWNNQYNGNPNYAKTWDKNWTVSGENSYKGGNEYWRGSGLVPRAGYYGYSGGYGVEYAGTNNRFGRNVVQMNASVGDDATIAPTAVNDNLIIEDSTKPISLSGNSDSYQMGTVEGAYQCGYITNFDNFCYEKPACPIANGLSCLFGHIFGGSCCLNRGCLNKGCCLGQSCLGNGCFLDPVPGNCVADVFNPYGDYYYSCGDCAMGVYAYQPAPVATYTTGYCCNSAPIQNSCCSDPCAGITFEGTQCCEQSDMTTFPAKDLQENSDPQPAQDNSWTPEPADKPVPVNTNPVEISSEDSAYSAPATNPTPVLTGSETKSAPQATREHPTLQQKSQEAQPVLPNAPQGNTGSFPSLNTPDTPSTLQYPLPSGNDSLIPDPNAIPGTTGYLQMSVPSDAVVYINGYRTKMTGTERRYAAQNLEPGMEYQFEIYVEVVRNGQTFSDTQTAVLYSGTTREVAFNMVVSDHRIAMNR